MERCYNLQTCAQNSDLERDIALCEKAGFKLVEIDFAKARAYLKDHTLEDLTALLKKHHMGCASINAIFAINFCSEDEWARVCADLDLACDLCAASGADRVIALSNERVDLPQGVTPQQVFDDTVSALRRMAERSAPRGVKIAFEPVGTMGIGDMATAWRVVQAADRPDIGIVIDDFNLYLWDVGADFDEIHKATVDKIFMVHINDAAKMPFALLDQNHRVMPGDGRIDVAYYMECVKATGYDGPVSIEILNSEIWAKGPETVIPEAYEKISKFVG